MNNDKAQHGRGDNAADSDSESDASASALLDMDQRRRESRAKQHSKNSSNQVMDLSGDLDNSAEEEIVTRSPRRRSGRLSITMKPRPTLREQTTSEEAEEEDEFRLSEAEAGMRSSNSRQSAVTIFSRANMNTKHFYGAAGPGIGLMDSSLLSPALSRSGAGLCKSNERGTVKGKAAGMKGKNQLTEAIELSSSDEDDYKEETQPRGLKSGNGNASSQRTSKAKQQQSTANASSNTAGHSHPSSKSRKSFSIEGTEDSIDLSGEDDSTRKRQAFKLRGSSDEEPQEERGGGKVATERVRGIHRARGTKMNMNIASMFEKAAYRQAQQKTPPVRAEVSKAQEKAWDDAPQTRAPDDDTLATSDSGIENFKTMGNVCKGKQGASSLSARKAQQTRSEQNEQVSQSRRAHKLSLAAQRDQQLRESDDDLSLEFHITGKGKGKDEGAAREGNVSSTSRRRKQSSSSDDGQVVIEDDSDDEPRTKKRRSTSLKKKNLRCRLAVSVSSTSESEEEQERMRNRRASARKQTPSSATPCSAKKQRLQSLRDRKAGGKQRSLSADSYAAADDLYDFIARDSEEIERDSDDRRCQRRRGGRKKAHDVDEDEDKDRDDDDDRELVYHRFRNSSKGKDGLFDINHAGNVSFNRPRDIEEIWHSYLTLVVCRLLDVSLGEADVEKFSHARNMLKDRYYTAQTTGDTIAFRKQFRWYIRNMRSLQHFSIKHLDPADRIGCDACKTQRLPCHSRFVLTDPVPKRERVTGHSWLSDDESDTDDGDDNDDAGSDRSSSAESLGVKSFDLDDELQSIEFKIGKTCTSKGVALHNLCHWEFETKAYVEDRAPMKSLVRRLRTGPKQLDGRDIEVVVLDCLETLKNTYEERSGNAAAVHASTVTYNSMSARRMARKGYD